MKWQESDDVIIDDIMCRQELLQRARNKYALSMIVKRYLNDILSWNLLFTLIIMQHDDTISAGDRCFGSHANSLEIG